MEAIATEGLTKTFSQTTKALDGVDLSIGEGQVFGFLGPNGSGKTTTVRLLSGVLAPTAGSSRVFGIDPAASPEAVHGMAGIVTEHAQMYDHMTGLQNLVFYATLFGMEADEGERRARSLIGQLALDDASDRRLATYSTGMRQRLSLARALIHDPKILFLDEPTSGLDPESAKMVNDLIDSLAKDRGKTVFLCTHQLRYAQEICTSYGLLDKGVLLAEGDIDHLRSLVFSGTTVTIKADRLPEGLDARKAEGGSFDIDVGGEEDIPAMVKGIVDIGGSVYRVTSRKPSLEDIYFALIDRRKAEGGAA